MEDTNYLVYSGNYFGTNMKFNGILVQQTLINKRLKQSLLSSSNVVTVLSQEKLVATNYPSKEQPKLGPITITKSRVYQGRISITMTT